MPPPLVSQPLGFVTFLWGRGSTFKSGNLSKREAEFFLGGGGDQEYSCFNQDRNILLSPCPQKHAFKCMKIPADCSNGCGQIITREEVKLEDRLEK